MREIHLHGALAKFGGPYRLDVNSPAEAVRALAVQMPAFRRAMRDGFYRIVRGDPHRGLVFDESMLNFRLGQEPNLHIVPVAAGAGRGGVGKIVMGAVLIAAVFITAGAAAPAAAGTLAAGEAAATFGTGAVAASGGLGATAFTVAGASITYGNIAMLGVSMVLSGASSLLSAQPKTGSYANFENAANRPSFLFSNGAVNTVEQGQPVPLILGMYLVGSSVVSGGIQTEELP